jgi:pimeloyl-ACP methyl ester carboxylesterase
MHAAALTILAVLAVGGTEITVQPGRGDRSYASTQPSLAALERPGQRTVEVIRRYDLERQFRRNPEAALQVLERNARAAPDPDLVYALAELSWLEGRRLDRRRRPEALDRYLDAVAYAFDFLLDPDPALVAGRQGSDSRYRMACNLYNGGLDRLLRAALAESGGVLGPDGVARVKVHGREHLLRVDLSHCPWRPGEVERLIPASDFEVTGLDSTSRQDGLGVPLVGIRRAREHPKGAERFFPPETAFPLTAFLSPVSKLRDAGRDVDAPRPCTLNLVDPILFPFVERGAGTLPLESDLTTPLASMWSRTDLNRYRWKGLLRPGEAADRAGLMLLRPYDPNKIPVVMVHGLMSSPLAWIPMLNELLRDPQIHARYQFLLFLYPTGVPVPIAASMLRDALRDAERTFDPPGRKHPAFSQMVLLGHSMGGLLSHAMALSSGNKLWELSTDRPFDEILGPKPVLDELRHYSFFEPLPFVRRVVFLATPHRGSEYSRRPVGRLGASLISEPDHYHDLLARLIKDNPDSFDRRQFRHLPTSIETLEPITPGRPSVLSALLEMKASPDVTFHSIIGTSRPGPVASSTDTVVPYASSHLDVVPNPSERPHFGTVVASECRVRSDHGVQRDREAIREVRRILLKNLVAEGGAETIRR